MAVAFLLGELFAAGYAVIAIWGLLISLLPVLIGRSFWKYKKADVLLVIAAFASGVLLIRCIERPKEAFGYIKESIPVTVEGEILSIKDNANYSNVILENANVIYNGKEHFTDGILLYLSDVSGLRRGDVIAASGELSSFSLPRNNGEFNSYNYYMSQGIYYNITVDEDIGIRVVLSKKFPLAEWLNDLRKNLVYEFLEHCYSIKDAGTMSAITLGEKEYMDKELQESFQMSGISHILAVSGLHISLIGMGIYKLLKRLLGHLPSCIISSIFVILYVGMTGFGTSGQRALIMFAVAMFGNSVGRSYDLNSGIGLALTCMLVKTPYLFLNAGFTLSYLSVLAIGMVLPFLDDISKWAFDKKMSEGMAGIAIFWMTLPVVAWNYYEYSLYSLILNLLVIPCMSLLVVLGTAGLLGELLFGFGEILLKGPVHILLRYFEKLCLFFNEMSAGRILFGRPELWQMLCVYTLLSIVLCIYFVVRQLVKRHFEFAGIFSVKKIKLFVLVMVVLGISIAEIWLLMPKNNGELRITMLDVGQGESIFIETPTGEKLLLDSGSMDVQKLYERRVLPFLKANAVKTLDYIIVSHADMDHCSAIREILEEDSGISVERLVLPDVCGEDENITELIMLGSNKGSTILRLGRGDIIELEALSFYCLNPDSKDSYTKEGRNDGSIVLHMKYYGFDMLFAGDIGENIEKELASLLKKCEVLKAAHHGSKYSNSMYLLENTAPQIALISCGEKNSYGHPHAETLERLEAVGSRVFLTKDKGAVTVTVDKGKIRISSFVDD